jgi:pimeloyl-ACP methyl ester carboxylesterase
MRIVDRGGGTPVVVIPGVQGRWEWMAPAIDALAKRCRVVTFSLADEPTSGGRFDEGHGFACYVDQVREALDAAGIREATICGVSYGGLIAAAFAARYPARTSSLVLVSALPAGWHPNARVRFYLRAPRLLMPLFMVASLRMYPEIAAANDGVATGMAAALRHCGRVVTHMFSPSRMARRVGLLPSVDLRQELSTVTAPVLIVTGEPPLDRVVPVTDTHEYLQLWPDAHVATIARTGHLGLITRPAAFANVVVPFAERCGGSTSRPSTAARGALSEVEGRRNPPYVPDNAGSGNRRRVG